MENFKDWSTVSKVAEESNKIQPKVFLGLTAPSENNTYYKATVVRTEWYQYTNRLMVHNIFK